MEVAWNHRSILTFLRMAKKPVGIEIIEEGDERFLVKTFEDGSDGYPS